MSKLIVNVPVPAPVPRPGAPWHRLALVALLAWAGWAFAVEGWRVAGEIRHPTPPGAVAAWHLGTPGSLVLRDYLHAIRPHLPAGSVVAFSHHTDDRDQRFFLTLWTAYFLPAQRVVELPPPAASPDLAAVPADYVVTFAYRLRRDDLEEVASHPSGSLYRVVRPGGEGAAPPGGGR